MNSLEVPGLPRTAVDSEQLQLVTAAMRAKFDATLPQRQLDCLAPTVGSMIKCVQRFERRPDVWGNSECDLAHYSGRYVTK